MKVFRVGEGNAPPALVRTDVFFFMDKGSVRVCTTPLEVGFGVPSVLPVGQRGWRSLAR